MYTWGAAGSRGGDSAPSVRRAVFPAQHIMHAWRALCPSCMADAVHVVGSAAMRVGAIHSRARRSILMGAVGGAATPAHVLGEKLGTMRCRLGFSPTLTYMWQAPCKHCFE